ncbi:MAG: RNA-binding domain-containing protein [Thermodesulfobacteriota bacterium]
MEINAEYIRNLAKGFYKDEETERPKLDVKRKWYDLSENNKRDVEEFCKDLAAMANTPGPEGHIIIGVDEKRKLGARHAN